MTPVKPRIVVAPDKFKGSCTARSAAEAIVAGLRDAWGEDYDYQIVPLADGGEGTVDVFLENGAVPVYVDVPDALGRPVRHSTLAPERRASWRWLRHPDSPFSVIEGRATRRPTVRGCSYVTLSQTARTASFSVSADRDDRRRGRRVALRWAFDFSTDGDAASR